MPKTQKTTSYATKQSNAKILDIGAGAGAFSILLKRLGFDVTATNLVVTEEPEIVFFRKFGVNFIPLNLDEQTIPFPDNYYDAILCMHVIEHLKKQDELLLETWRVLRPGGKLIIMTPNRIATTVPRFINRLRLLLGESIYSPNPHTREYTLRELISMLKFCGFKICSIEYSNAMVSARVAGLKATRKVLDYAYCFGCKLFPMLSYEIHIAAQKSIAKGV